MQYQNKSEEKHQTDGRTDGVKERFQESLGAESGRDIRDWRADRERYVILEGLERRSGANKMILEELERRSEANKNDPR